MEALKKNRIAGAGLDVYENEPKLTPGLKDLSNVVLTPHTGSATIETRATMSELAAKNIVEVLNGRPALTPVKSRKVKFMKSLKSYIKDAEKRKVAIGHFNISDSAGLKAIFEAAKELSDQAGRQIPIIIGLSDGERGFVGIRQAAAMVKNYQKENDYPIF